MLFFCRGDIPLSVLFVGPRFSPPYNLLFLISRLSLSYVDSSLHFFPPPSSHTQCVRHRLPTTATNSHTSPLSAMSTPTPLSSTHVGALLHVLRTANRRYTELAAAVRSAQRPTHHARKRAAALKLSVSIAAARGLDPRQISAVPLPVLERERAASPAPAHMHTRSRGPAIPPPRVTVVAPMPRRALRGAAHLATPPPRVARPGLRSAVPQVLVVAPKTGDDEDVPPRSHWSSSSSSGGEDDGEDTDADAPRLDVPIDASRLSWNSAASFSAGSRASSAESPDTAGPETPVRRPFSALCSRLMSHLFCRRTGRRSRSASSASHPRRSSTWTTTTSPSRSARRCVALCDWSLYTSNTHPTTPIVRTQALDAAGPTPLCEADGCCRRLPASSLRSRTLSMHPLNCYCTVYTVSSLFA